MPEDFFMSVNYEIDYVTAQNGCRFFKIFIDSSMKNETKNKSRLFSSQFNICKLYNISCEWAGVRTEVCCSATELVLRTRKIWLHSLAKVVQKYEKIQAKISLHIFIFIDTFIST